MQGQNRIRTKIIFYLENSVLILLQRGPNLAAGGVLYIINKNLFWQTFNSHIFVNIYILHD